MAIEKSFFSQYGWEVPDEYYKIDGWRIINEEKNSYEFAVGVYRNAQARNDNKEPITTNLMRVVIDRGAFDSNLSEDDNLKTQAYNNLKTLTRSFVEEAVNL